MGLIKRWQVERSNTLELVNGLVEVKDGAITPEKLSSDIIKTLQASNTQLISSDTFSTVVSLTVEANYYKRLYMVIFAVMPPGYGGPAAPSIDSMVVANLYKDTTFLAVTKAWNQSHDTYAFFSGQTYIHLESDTQNGHTFKINVAVAPNGKEAKVKGEIKVVGI
ncbi:MAG: hypothetical protein DRP01_03075 [Archaeoglobales archaeon]|nr:MAG: hypothetical protein DRP01_03075 [Archaeoglobales archaeon]